MIQKVQKFVGEVVVELKKVSWSTRQELINATWVVFVCSAVLGVMIGLVDFALSKLVSLIIQ